MLARAVRRAPRRTILARSFSSSSSSSSSHSSGADGDDTTHFGFKQVARQDKEKLVGEVFSNVAQQYDVMNDLMSGTLHRQWKDSFVDTLLPLSVSDGSGYRAQHIDLAGGTGDIAFRILQRSKALSPSDPAPRVHVVDINQSMLDVGQQRADKLALSDDLLFVQQNAEELEKFEDNMFDSYSM